MGMFAAELTYRSWVALNGYRWVRYGDLHGEKGDPDYSNRVLTEVHSTTDPTESPRRYRACDPFKDHPALYREFAAIPWGDADAIKAFAGRYGMLDSDRDKGQHAFDLPPGVYIRNRQNWVPCDPEEDWTQGPATFRAMIRA